MVANLIPLLTIEAQIKRRLRAHLRALGFVKNSKGQLSPPEFTKETYRALHLAQRADKISAEAAFVDKAWARYRGFFADGSEVRPEKIEPELEVVNGGTWQSDLFRLTSHFWSVPVSSGYGRRMRFLVWDRHNRKLIGLIGLGDPVFNLRVRDEKIGWDYTDRKKRLCFTMDAYVLGAIPPYNQLLCGKLLACLVKSREMVDAFKEKYYETKGIISKKRKHAQLVLVTTSSSLGRSSVYNRLKINGEEYFTSIGATSGWGHFHVPNELFSTMRMYLRRHHNKYSKNYKYGNGPNWRLRAIRLVLTKIGENPNTLRHGIGREVFVSRLARNAENILCGKATRPNYKGLKSVGEIAELAKERWIVKRAQNRPEFRVWKQDEFFRALKAVSQIAEGVEEVQNVVG